MLKFPHHVNNGENILRNHARTRSYIDKFFLGFLGCWNSSIFLLVDWSHVTILFQITTLELRRSINRRRKYVWSESKLVFRLTWLDWTLKKYKLGSNVTQSNHFESNFVESFEIDRWSFQLRLLDHQNKGKKNGTSRCDFGPRYKNPIAEKIPLDRAPSWSVGFLKRHLQGNSVSVYGHAKKQTPTSAKEKTKILGVKPLLPTQPKRRLL